MDLWTVLKDEWCELPPRYLQTLVESMPHRVAALLCVHGALHDIRQEGQLLWTSHHWVIGITDSAAKISKEEDDLKAKANFLKTISINDEGRYEVALPWKENHIPLSSHKDLALKRLQKVTTNLKSDNFYQVYDNVLKKWSELGIIEEVPPDDVNSFGHHLPRRPVIKQKSSTEVRPVFVASAREKSTISLNQCLNCGPNLIEFIPSLLLRLQERKYGVSADIEKALLQISVRKSDRDYLRFSWWTENGHIKVYRHTRVVSGVVSSPFLPGAVLKFHLKRLSEDPHYNKRILGKLKKKFYVDNVVAIVDREEEIYQFIHEAKDVMSKGMFNLRAWQCTGDKKISASSLWGILWKRDADCLQLNLQRLERLEKIKVTKREMLSIAKKIFDPIGIVCPVLLVSKLLLQKMWKTEILRDDEVDEGTKREFSE
ncbi:hypothetical protein AVEN_114557-1 [Araneus ventricosus]|uniref:Reverse transcriptase domain-containing protein n=1 Tax=Araneus ventricosus TaxID=182803 RepID=A0A4Y2LYG7_ARAVE|nr:hypothetical protein AVEN_114557-1 [Araneus ventricosus]